ncbi:MAG: Thioredoxin [Gaiellales bacterium]|jgi:thioredoxin-like negative regulator of GroEL|nr:Thioredoxin [Gaiellales bacterium]
MYFTSARSGPARRVESLLDQVLQERRNHEAFDRTVVDVDEDRTAAARYAVDAVPTILVVEDGEEMCRIDGRPSVAALREALSPWLR